jgi:hypothetical protein
MTKSQLIKMLQQSGGSVFITKKGVAEAFGIKDVHNVSPMLSGLPKVNNKYYYIPEVAEALLARTK